MKKTIIMIITLCLLFHGAMAFASELEETPRTSEVELDGLDWECLYDGENNYVCGWCLGRNICTEEGGGYFDDVCMAACGIVCAGLGGERQWRVWLRAPRVVG